MLSKNRKWGHDLKIAYGVSTLISIHIYSNIFLKKAIKIDLVELQKAKEIQ